MVDFLHFFIIHAVLNIVMISLSLRNAYIIHGPVCSFDKSSVEYILVE